MILFHAIKLTPYLCTNDEKCNKAKTRVSHNFKNYYNFNNYIISSSHSHFEVSGLLLRK